MNIPVRIKVSTGATIIGFMDKEEGSEYYNFYSACYYSYDRMTGRVDVSDVFDPCLPVQINGQSIVCMQPVSDTSEIAIVYCSYLGSWLAMMEDEGCEVDTEVLEYVDHMDPSFQMKSEGVGIHLYGQYSYLRGLGEDTTEIEGQIEEARRLHNGGKPKIEVTCIDNILTIDFSSKKI